MGHDGLRRSTAGHWHSSTVFRGVSPTLCTLLSPALTCWPGPHQAEPFCLLWASQSEKKPSHGCLRSEVLQCLYFIFSNQKAVPRLCLRLTRHVLLQSKSSGSWSGQWGGQRWAKVSSFPALVRYREKWWKKGNASSLIRPDLHSQPISLVSMWPCHKSKTLSQALRHFYQTCLLISQVLCFCFHLLSRNWATRGFDCAHIPTPLPKSVCVLLVLPATTILHVTVLVSNSETDNLIK